MNYELGYVSNGLGEKANILERRWSYFSAQYLICVSASTKRELLEVYPQLENRCPIEVIYHGCEFIPSTVDDLGRVETLGPYILFVGGRQSYKRFDDLLLGFAYSDLKKDGVRVICTGAPLTEHELSVIKKHGLSGQVISLGKVNSSFLSALYERAHCLVYPSVHEGFGMPLIEAMQHECPVIACNVSCIPEIVGNAAVLVPPESPGNIATALLQLNCDDTRGELINNGKQRAAQFSWDASAQAHMAIYRQAAELP